MTHLVSMATVLGVFQGRSIVFFPQKPLIKDTAQMALFVAFYESATAKIALCIYLRMTLKGNLVGLA